MKLIVSLTVLALSISIEASDYQKFLNSIKMVESGGNAKAIGDGGKAVGAYQIHKEYFQDAQEYDKKNKGKFGIADKSYKDCFNPNVAKQVVCAYLERYSAANVKAGKWEVLARQHNGGLNGHKINSTKVYWVKVQKEMNK